MRMSTPEEIAQALLILASSPDVEHRNLAAVDPRTPGEGLAAIFASGYYSYQLLHNPNLPIEVMREALTWPLGICLTLNPSLPEEMAIELLTRHPHSFFKLCYRKGKSQRFEEILHDFALRHYHGLSVLAGQAETIDIIERLSRHSDQSVRVQIVENPNTPLEIWGKMISDRHRFVRAAVQERANKVGVLGVLG